MSRPRHRRWSSRRWDRCCRSSRKTVPSTHLRLGQLVTNLPRTPLLQGAENRCPGCPWPGSSCDCTYRCGMTLCAVRISPMKLGWKVKGGQRGPGQAPMTSLFEGRTSVVRVSWRARTSAMSSVSRSPAQPDIGMGRHAVEQRSLRRPLIRQWSPLSATCHRRHCPYGSNHHARSRQSA